MFVFFLLLVVSSSSSFVLGFFCSHHVRLLLFVCVCSTCIYLRIGVREVKIVYDDDHDHAFFFLRYDETSFEYNDHNR